jgi:hypothetical protein
MNTDAAQDPKFTLQQRPPDGKYAMFKIENVERVTRWLPTKAEVFGEFKTKYGIHATYRDETPDSP